VRFLVGVLLGLLLSGPAVHHHFDTTVVQHSPSPSQEEATVDEFMESESNKVFAVDGEEQCVIDMLGGSLAEFDARDIMAVLEVAWLLYDGPCDMMERTND
jgi:hypothetical protein